MVIDGRNLESAPRGKWPVQAAYPSLGPFCALCCWSVMASRSRLCSLSVNLSVIMVLIFSSSQKSEREYDYVLDEEIDFVQALQMPGTRKDNVSKQ